jgi:hypothetical protein
LSYPQREGERKKERKKERFLKRGKKERGIS